ncbi:MAG: NTP transferase domain-containing protein [Pseudomonadota bacterium]
MDLSNAPNQPSRTGYVAIVLAGQRPGVDPVAAAHDLRAKALAPALGVPLVDRVLGALRRSERIDRCVIVEDKSLEPLTAAKEVACAVESGDAVVEAASSTICGSVLKALARLPRASKFLVTTADNVLLTPEIVAEFLDAADGAEIAIGMVDRKTIEARYDGIPRTYFPFADARVSGANLFAIHGAKGADAVEFWRLIEKNRKNPLRVFAAFGVSNLIGGALRLFTLASAFDRLSKRVGVSVRPVLLSQPEAAIDVDKIIDLIIADGIIARRAIAEGDGAASRKARAEVNASMAPAVSASEGACAR